MAEETPDKETGEEETPETSEEKKEEKPKEEEKPSEEESEEEASTETKKPSEEEEPQLRIPSEKGDQTKEEKRLGFETRKLRKENKKLREDAGEDIEDEDETDKVEGLRQEMNEKLGVIADKGESEGLLSQFLRKYPSYQKYERKIRKYMDHPAYRQVPIGFIADGIAGQDLVEEGAEKSKKAEKEAGETKSGGSSHRGALGKEPDIWSMTKEEFKKYQDKIREKGRE